MTTDKTAKAIEDIEARWPDAVDRAKQWEPGMLRSAWTMPVEALVNEREHILRDLGWDPATLNAPKAPKHDGEEAALPEHVRAAYRRGVHLHGKLRTAHAFRQRQARRQTG